jgi:hypothetical protein
MESPPPMAKTVVSPEVANEPGHAQDQAIMRQVYTEHIVGLRDAADGRRFFGNSPDKINSRPIGKGRQTVHERFGPFDHGKGRPQYIYIYNDPPPRK